MFAVVAVHPRTIEPVPEATAVKSVGASAYEATTLTVWAMLPADPELNGAVP